MLIYNSGINQADLLGLIGFPKINYKIPSHIALMLGLDILILLILYIFRYVVKGIYWHIDYNNDISYYIVEIS